MPQIRVTGSVPRGLPSPFLDFPWAEWRSLLAPAMVISSAAYLETIGIAKALAAKNGYQVDANQELVGEYYSLSGGRGGGRGW